MNFCLRNFSSLALYLLWSLALISAEIDDPKILMGPLLHFNGADAKTKTWQVSALYLLPQTSKNHPLLAFEERGKREVSVGEIIGSEFGYDFVRYDMILHRIEQRKSIEYHLTGEKNLHAFFVPAITRSPKTLYHSCNGYQCEADREKVGGIAPMWAEINRRHQEEPFDLQLGGGDQLYADGLVNKPCEGSKEPVKGRTFGVFALPSIQAWLKNRDALDYAPFTEEMKKEAKRFYFDHYILHYTSEEFKTAMASIPSLVQPDDHDYYDGCGSYPPYLQNSPVMSGLRSIAGWYAFTIQHQLNMKEVPENEITKIKTHSFLHVVAEIAICGVDTRSERTEDQVVSENSYYKIFSELDQLGPETKHLLVMLAIPVVYASTKALEKAFKVAESIKPIDAVVSLIPDVKNAFGLFELADDCRDGWGHKAHKRERNELIIRFQELANKKNIRVTFIGGDVHLGGAGKIYHKECGINDCSANAITQIISSPVGNITVGKVSARIIGKIACHEKKIDNDCRMCVFKLRKEKKNKEGHSLIKHRNFVILKLSPDMQLDVEWSAESKKSKAHKIYRLTVPSVPISSIQQKYIQ